MKWISVKDASFPLNKRLLVTDGESLGHLMVDQYDIEEWDDYKLGFAEGIPDYSSHSLRRYEISHWCLIPELPKDDE